MMQRVCARCLDSATILQGHQWLCDRHYRFGQMRANAKRAGKTVPPHHKLEVMLGADLCCPDCGVQMNWRARDGQATVASLQHYRDGTWAIVCRSCNTRHAFMPDDAYRTSDKNTKWCPQCKSNRPFKDFFADNNRSGPAKRKSWCRQCSGAAHQKWTARNRDRRNEYQRAYRIRRAANGNPIRRTKS